VKKEDIHHRVTEDTERKTREPFLYKGFLVLFFSLLCVLCDSVVNLLLLIQRKLKVIGWADDARELEAWRRGDGRFLGQPRLSGWLDRLDGGNGAQRKSDHAENKQALFHAKLLDGRVSTGAVDSGISARDRRDA
jgi:hypothetical protein